MYCQLKEVTALINNYLIIGYAQSYALFFIINQLTHFQYLFVYQSIETSKSANSVLPYLPSPLPKNLHTYIQNVQKQAALNSTLFHYSYESTIIVTL
jgi:hypothetical protein